MTTATGIAINFRELFESSPALVLLLSPDFTIIGATESYLNATLIKRDEVMGRNIFDVFPDNPDDPTADGVSNLRASLQTVLANKVALAMSVQKYDIRRPDGTFEERYWKPLNIPILNDSGEVIYITHRVEDVTGQEQMRKNMDEYLKRNEALQANERKYIADLKASEDRFMKIFNFSPIAVFITNVADGRLKYLNKAFEKLFLYSSEEAVNKTLAGLSIIDEQTRATLARHILEENGNIVETELDLKDSRGATRKILASTLLINIDDQECFLNAMIDITERNNTEEVLRQTNHFLDTVLENIPNMVFVKDAEELRFIRFNKAGEDILGYSRTDLIGKNDRDFFPQEQAEFFIEKDRDVFKNQTLLDIPEEPIQTRYGERWLHTKKIPVFENGEPRYLIGISDDITERKKQQDAILQLNKELEAFTYSVSHDLRAPLRAVTGFAQMLDEDYRAVLGSDGQRLLDVISNNAEKMGKLIDDLLAFSRLGRKDVRHVETDMNELVADAVREVNKSMTHSAVINVSKLHKINSDPSLMKQVLVNLLGNAVKYSAKKEAPVIEVTSWLAGNDIVFSIKDNGAGFDMRYVDKLFGVFQRLHGQDEFEGTGVGLAIVHRVITKHDGKVWAEGKVGEGATIYFSIPVKL